MRILEGKVKKIVTNKSVTNFENSDLFYNQGKENEKKKIPNTKIDH